MGFWMMDFMDKKKGQILFINFSYILEKWLDRKNEDLWMRISGYTYGGWIL